MSHLNKRLLTY